MNENPIIEMRGISKRFGAVHALRSVDLELRPGEILGLVGDNAAGKSTLMKILIGAILPDEGVVFFEGKRAAIRSPLDASALGISMVFQDLALFNNLDVAANIFIGRERTLRLLGLPFLDRTSMRAEARHLIDRMRVNISSPDLVVHRMSGGQRQMVACARAIAFQSKVLLMDEPTAALGVKEANSLLQKMVEWKGEGLSIILITQRIPDVLAIGDRIMVLKGGERHGVLKVGDCTLSDVVTLIVQGRPGGGAQETEGTDFLSFG